MRKLLFIFISLTLMAFPLEAKKIKGSVKSEGTPLSGVIVSDGYRFTTTASDGSFTLNTHKDARYVFVITPSGFVADYSTGAPAFYQSLKDSPKSFDFSLQPCTAEELEGGWNPHYFKPGATRTLDIDFGQSGLAGEMTWGEGGVPWAQHRLPTGKGQVLKYAFELR